MNGVFWPSSHRVELKRKARFKNNNLFCSKCKIFYSIKQVFSIVVDIRNYQY